MQQKWYVIDSESKGNYLPGSRIKFLTSSLESSLCDYSDGYVLVTGNITATGGNVNTKVAFKNWTPFKECRREINETIVDEAEHINIAMPTYDLIEYSSNYYDTSGSLWQFKRHGLNAIDINTNLTDDNAPSFKDKASIIDNTVADGHKSKKNNVKLAAPLKYLSNFWRSLEMSLINCKVELLLDWYAKCVLIIGNWIAVTFAITNRKLYVPVVTLKTKDNAKLSKLLNEGFKRSVYLNKYKIISKGYAANENIRERLDASFQGVSKLFVIAYQRGDANYVNEEAFNKYFLPKITIEKYNVEIDGRNFYDQAISDPIKQYEEVRKISTGQGDDYTVGCLLDFAYFDKNYRLIAPDLSKQKAIDADPKAIQ